MTFVQHFRNEKYKTSLSIAIAVAGFLVALLINSGVERYQEYQAYLLMRHAIKIEAESNADTLKTAFLKYYKNGVVLQQFNTTVVSQLMYSTTFLKFSTNTEINILSEYYRNLTLANRYREKSEAMILEGKGSQLFVNLLPVWQVNLQDCERNISAIATLP